MIENHDIIRHLRDNIHIQLTELARNVSTTMMCEVKDFAIPLTLTL